jgi:manganese/zinc/iron transport system permease protein
MEAFWIILAGALVAICCALLGTFLLLRNMAMVGDAISHAVLPGIAVAYLVSGTRESLPMLLGAAVFGVLATVFIEWLYRRARLQSDAAIGITFTALFAAGIILISLFAGQIDLDLDCVLFGEIAYVPIDLWITREGVILGPRAVWIHGGLLLFILLWFRVGFKGLVITSFHPEYAATLGISAAVWHYSLMSAVSLTSVLAFESVGAVLVVAFLIVPPATAFLLTDKLRTMLWLGVGFGIGAALGGYYLAVWLNGSIAGAMAVISGVFFVAALLFSPRGGFLRKKRAITPF